jgi:ribosomal protein S27E
MVCSSCGHATPTFPAPHWLKSVVPSASQVFFADREAGGAAAGKEAECDQQAERPIALACPQCGGSLLITAESERTIPCRFCNVDVYLPDGVWLKLHPAKVAKFWLVRFR